tara:strand:+ start:1103 stop:1324 length:222 start_codon:yes stop_codon:yes gene_type:complete
MIETVFIFIAYSVGTAMGLWFANQKIRKSIEDTVDNLIAQGYLQTKKLPDGELDILKWYDRQEFNQKNLTSEE